MTPHRTQRKRALYFLACGTAAGLALSACTASTPGTAAGGAESSDTIRTNLTADPTTFSPLLGRSKDDYALARYLYDTLVRRDADGSMAPGLASKWDVTAKGGTFTIRDGATCSDGTPITADVVANSLKAFSDKKTGNATAAMIFGPGTTTIDADDATKSVKISLSEPWADMLTGLSHSLTGVICPAGLKDPQGLSLGKVEGAYSGPYTVASSEHGVRYELQLRQDYDAWPQFTSPLKGKAPQNVVLAISGNDSTLANQLLTQGSDLGLIGGRDAERFKNNQGFSAQTIPAANLYVMFNQRDSSVFKDETLRHAVAQIIDAKAFNQAATSGSGQVNASLVGESVPFAVTDRSDIIGEDMAAAKQVLNGKKVRIVASQTMGNTGSAGSYLLERLREAGADATLVNTDNSTWSTTITTKPDTWDITVMGDVNALRTMGSALIRINGATQAEGGLNIADVRNPDSLRAFTAAMSTTDDQERAKLFAEAQKALVKRADFVPLITLTQTMVTRKDVSVRIVNGVIDDATVRIGG